MADADNKPNSEQPERNFSQEQYDMLMRCSDNKDMTEWSKYRDEHLGEVIWLQGAELAFAHLKRADFMQAHLEGARLREAHLERADFVQAHLEGTELMGAYLKDADLREAHLEGAKLMGANLEGAILTEAHLENADLDHAYLQGAKIWKANMRGANLTDARLQRAILSRAHLQQATFTTAIVDGETAFWMAEVNKAGADFAATDFRGVGLNNVRIDSGTKQLLEYNIRRMNWERWYKKHPLLQWPVRAFWALSDYGLSTWRVIIWFFVLSFLFAAVYSNLAYWFPPGVVNDLYAIPEPRGQASCLDLTDYGLEVFFRPIYFSVVTMTTLGFGDMYARPGSWLGHVLLMLQVILGYVLLGALVTRFAVLFTAGGPAGTFSERQPQEQAKSGKGGTAKQQDKERHGGGS
jgi:uncharacterized protein YjbI with pentapeptide repeats